MRSFTLKSFFFGFAVIGLSGCVDHEKIDQLESELQELKSASGKLQTEHDIAEESRAEAEELYSSVDSFENAEAEQLRQENKLLEEELELNVRSNDKLAELLPATSNDE